ncbi:hypothetical protein AGLY_006811 [Aphis glycines]|uniref:Uncharacterized protein n=1 Tax=Aphis glycines TaxID=307491 RepID=A0A6G0TRK4_APHGL|nr:hypothetical protein AGLY_006811 [Aphis glycines]
MFSWIRNRRQLTRLVSYLNIKILKLNLKCLGLRHSQDFLWGGLNTFNLMETGSDLNVLKTSEKCIIKHQNITYYAFKNHAAYLAILRLFRKNMQMIINPGPKFVLKLLIKHSGVNEGLQILRCGGAHCHLGHFVIGLYLTLNASLKINLMHVTIFKVIEYISHDPLIIKLNPNVQSYYYYLKKILIPKNKSLKVLTIHFTNKIGKFYIDTFSFLCSLLLDFEGSDKFHILNEVMGSFRWKIEYPWCMGVVPNFLKCVNDD